MPLCLEYLDCILLEDGDGWGEQENSFWVKCLILEAILSLAKYEQSMNRKITTKYIIKWGAIFISIVRWKMNIF